MGHKVENPFYRLASRIRIVDGCWILPTARYGLVWVDGHSKSAHRYMYEKTIGEIPEGLVLDHLCRQVNCVNPDHLEAVTQKENVRRSLPFRMGK